jgi:hypothetical protein
MRRLFPLLFLSILAGFTLLTSLPGCDKLVTDEYYYHDTLTNIVYDSTCVEVCHSDRNSIIDLTRREWLYSAHASGGLTDAVVSSGLQLYYTNVCGAKCHTLQGYIAQSTSTVSQPLEIQCKACHDYHTTWSYDLRYGGVVSLYGGGTFDDGNSNNCVSCHKSIRDVIAEILAIFEINHADSVPVSPFWGPHGSNQAEMFLGQGGFHYDEVDYSNLVHSSTFSGGCIKCHMHTNNDLPMGGHSMNMVDEGTENVIACNVSGCHSGNPPGITGFDTYSSSIRQNFFDSLAGLEHCLDSLRLLDTIGHIRPEGVAGALYNYRFIVNDQSNGIHNPKYSLRLASSSYEYMLYYIDSLNNLPPEE